MILLQARRSRRTVQVENGVLLAIKHMHVRRVMVVQINHDAGSADAENRWRVVTLSISCVQVNPNAWVFARLLLSTAKTLLQGPAKLRQERPRRYQPNGRGARFIKGHARSVEYLLPAWLRMTATFGQVTSGVSLRPLVRQCHHATVRTTDSCASPRRIRRRFLVTRPSHPFCSPSSHRFLSTSCPSPRLSSRLSHNSPPRSVTVKPPAASWWSRHSIALQILRGRERSPSCTSMQSAPAPRLTPTMHCAAQAPSFRHWRAFPYRLRISLISKARSHEQARACWPTRCRPRPMLSWLPGCGERAA